MTKLNCWRERGIHIAMHLLENKLDRILRQIYTPKCTPIEKNLSVFAGKAPNTQFASSIQIILAALQAVRNGFFRKFASL